MSPRALAVRWTVERFPQVLFWTFTFKAATTYEGGAVIWDRLRRAIVREWPDCRLLRVFEMHPGGHGLHIHAATPAWLAIRKMLVLAKRCGFGRIHVVRWDTKKGMAAGEYLAKYLSKPRAETMKHKRLYGTIGIPQPDKTFQKDITFTSPMTEIWAIMKFHPCWETWRFAEKTRICRQIFNRYVSEPETCQRPGVVACPEGAGVDHRALYLVITGTIRQGRDAVARYLGASGRIPAELKKKLDKSRDHRENGSTAPPWLGQEPTIQSEIEAYEHETNTYHAAIERGIDCPF